MSQNDSVLLFLKNDSLGMLQTLYSERIASIFWKLLPVMVDDLKKNGHGFRTLFPFSVGILIKMHKSTLGKIVFFIVLVKGRF